MADAKTPGLERALEEALARDLPARLALFEQAAADRLGIGLSDFRCLQIAAGVSDGDAPLTAGRLAELTGLSSGAITGVLDRLAVAGFVVRQKDPSDRRQVRIRFVEERGEALEALLAPFHAAFAALCARHDEAELTRLLAFARDAAQLVEDETTRLRGGPKTHASSADRAYDVVLPLEGARHGQLELRSVHGLRLEVGSGDFLCRGRFEGKTPAVRRRGGSVRLDGVAGGGLLAFLRPRAPSELELGAGVPWTIRLRGGASELEGDLRELALLGLEIKGGVHRVTLVLPRPSGTAPITISGGARDLKLTRPADVPLRVALFGGASRVHIDDLRLGAVGSELRWESPGFADASARYELELRGGVSELAITAS
jgi:DNA-binding MarR family transcriptional regulator